MKKKIQKTKLSLKARKEKHKNLSRVKTLLNRDSCSICSRVRENCSFCGLDIYLYLEGLKLKDDYCDDCKDMIEDYETRKSL